jgi:hypothetical protein
MVKDYPEYQPWEEGVVEALARWIYRAFAPAFGVPETIPNPAYQEWVRAVARYHEVVVAPMGVSDGRASSGCS